MISFNKSKGITIVEFTIVSSTMLLIVFSILEMGVFVFNMQSLNDLTRRTARIATVCQVSDGDLIKSLALSEEVPDGFTTSNLKIEYLDADGSPVADTENNFSSISFVRASVVDFNYGFFGFLKFLGDNGVISIPQFETILASESLGVERLDSDGNKSYTDCK
ncbi:pilus assembly protein [Vibrio diazotrophicus]|nr:pilus assembly protein [Vibrio diazotrophicus]